MTQKTRERVFFLYPFGPKFNLMFWDLVSNTKITRNCQSLMFSLVSKCYYKILLSRRAHFLKRVNKYASTALSMFFFIALSSHKRTTATLVFIDIRLGHQNDGLVSRRHRAAPRVKASQLLMHADPTHETLCAFVLLISNLFRTDWICIR